jgi:curved DNA-binding protein CbpA
MARIPRPLSGAPRVSLTADELELIEVIDGVRGAAEIAALTERTEQEVADQLERLAMIGVIAFEEASDAPTAGSEYLDARAREHIDRLYGVLGRADLYELLCVTREATKHDIKAAYYHIGPAFHPDRHFRKNLGPYKQKIEALFAAFTKAHDTLRYAKRREEYDAKEPAPRPGAPERRDLIRAAVEFLAPADRGADRRSSPGTEPGMSSPPPRGSQPSLRPPPAAWRSERPPAPTVPPPRARQESHPSIHYPPPRARQESHPSIDPSRSARPAAITSPVPPSPEPTRRPSFPGIPATHLDGGPAVEGRYRSSVPPATGPPAATSPPAISPPAPSPPPRRIAYSDSGEAATPPPRRIAYSDSGEAATPPPRLAPSDPSAPPVDADPEVRRDALARKLTARAGAALPPPAPSYEPRTRKRPEGTFQPATDVRKSAAEVVRDRFESVADAVKNRRLTRYLDQARVAMAAGDYRAASAAYEQALKIQPDDPELVDKAEEAARRALGQA